MSVATFAIVLAAAVLHASWNAMLKVTPDKTATIGLISLGHVTVGAALLFIAPLPAAASWPYLAASTLIHYAYYFLLARSYRIGDLSQVYPIARGIVPVLVALGAQASVGETLPLQVWIGVLTVSAGVMLLSAGAIFGHASRAVIGIAVTTGIFIAAYSIADGLGVRQANSALGYIAWLFVLEAPVVLYVGYLRRKSVQQIPRRALLLGVFGGMISALAYGLVIYAKEFSALGIVSALRETSVLFASMIGVILLGERPWRSRLLAALVVFAGVIIIALS
ncbi:MAG: drug/metabolite transporter (DMT)-like permease [Paracoccaceae bacterium]|jgi:drug/metabolite transporter (DMT)-like permease